MKERKLQLDASRRDVILVIGRSGVGKSAITEVLFGDLPALEATFDTEMLCTKITNTKAKPRTEEQSMFTSDTVCPQLFTDPAEPQLAIYDCPGFADTRGTLNEIATGVYLSQVIRHAERVKLVVAVDYDTVKPEADRSKFTDNILREVVDFVLNKEILQGGVLLLVTKYANPNEDSSNRFDDEDIVGSIVEFLREAQEYVVSRYKDRKAAVNALFKKSWLQVTKDGKYPNIAFSRTVATAGKLLDMEDLTRRTQIRDQLLHNPNFEFKTANATHFGCPISPKGKLQLRKVLRSFESEAQEFVRRVSQNVVSAFVQSANDKEQLSNFFDNYAAFLSALNQLPEQASGLTSESLELFRTFSNNIAADAGSELDKLEETVSRIKYLSGVDVEESSTTWKDARDKWNEAMIRMAKDLVIEFRKAQRDLALQVHQLLESVCRKVLDRFQASVNNKYSQLPCLLDNFHAFSEELQGLSGEEPRLNLKSVHVLRLFCAAIQVDAEFELEKLPETIACLRYLTGVDAEVSCGTWADVQMKWDHAIEFLKKDIAQLKAQRDFAETEAEAKRAVEQAKEELEAAKLEGEQAEAEAAAELAEAKAKATRAVAEAEKLLLLANNEKEMAIIEAQAAIAEANLRAKLAEEAMKEARKAHNEKSGTGLIDLIAKIFDGVIQVLPAALKMIGEMKGKK